MILVRLLTSVLLAATAHAAVIAYVEGYASTSGNNPVSTATIEGSSAASARLTQVRNGNAQSPLFDFEVATSPTYGDPRCILCGQSMDSRATMDGITGDGKLFTGVGLSTGTKGYALARADLEDSITVMSPMLALNLDAFWSTFERGANNPGLSVYETRVRFYMRYRLWSQDLGNVYDVVYEAERFYTSNFNTQVEQMTIWTKVGDAGGVSVTTVIPPGHISHAALIDATGFTNVPLNSDFTIRSEALCYKLAPGDDCRSVFDSWSTTHIGLDGNYTSANGYQYVGFADAPEVPEPATWWLAGSALAVLALRRVPRTWQTGRRADLR